MILDPPSTGCYMVTRLASFRIYLYAAPPCLAKHPLIRSQVDLERHDFVNDVQDSRASRALFYLNELGFTPWRRLRRPA